MSIAGNKERDLTTGPLVPKIILFALPLMATGILQLMFNAADLIIVGQFAPNGQEDIGAIGGTGPLINLVINLFIGLSVGTSVFTARYIGAGDREKTGQTVHTSMAVALVFSLPEPFFRGWEPLTSFWICPPGICRFILSAFRRVSFTISARPSFGRREIPSIRCSF